MKHLEQAFEDLMSARPASVRAPDADAVEFMRSTFYAGAISVIQQYACAPDREAAFEAMRAEVERYAKAQVRELDK